MRGRNEPHFMPEFDQRPPPMMRRRARLHRHHARRQLGEKRYELAAREFARHNHLALRVDRVNLKHPLRQIETNPRDSRQIPDRLAHGRLSFRWGFDNDHLGTLMPFGAPSTPSFAERTGQIDPLLPFLVALGTEGMRTITASSRCSARLRSRRLGDGPHRSEWAEARLRGAPREGLESAPKRTPRRLVQLLALGMPSAGKVAATVARTHPTRRQLAAITRLPGSPREGPELVAKAGFHCEGKRASPLEAEVPDWIPPVRWRRSCGGPSSIMATTRSYSLACRATISPARINAIPRPERALSCARRRFCAFSCPFRLVRRQR